MFQQESRQAVLFMRRSEMKGQDKRASSDVLERIQSQSCFESGTHYPRITSLLLAAWNTIATKQDVLSRLDNGCKYLFNMEIGGIKYPRLIAKVTSCAY